MKEKNWKKNSIKIAAVAIMIFFISSSAVQAVVKETSSFAGGTIFEWEDDFDSWGFIDTDRSSNIEINNDDEVQMVETYKAWHRPWPYMKKINIHNSGSYKPSYVMPITVFKESTMQSDYSDLRFVNVDSGVVYDLEYWLGVKRTSSVDLWVRIEPGVPGNSDHTIYMFWGLPSAPDMSNFNMIFKWDDRTSPDIMISHKHELEGAWDSDVAFGGGRFLVGWEERLGKYLIYDGEDWVDQMEKSIYCDIHGRTYNRDGGDPQPDPMDDEDIIISTGSQNLHCENPSIAYGSSKFLCVWEQNPANIQQRFQIDIYGSFVTTSGGVTQISSPICDASNIQADPCVCYGAGKYLVVWEDARQGTGNYDVWGAFVSTSGTVYSDFQITSGANYEGEPWVCSDGSNFVVFYEQGDDPEAGPFNLYAIKLTSSGSKIWGPNLVAQGTGSVDNVWPCVNYNPQTDQYLLCWNTGDLPGHPRGSIMGNFMEQDGSLVFSPNKVIQSGSNYIRTDCAPYLGDMFFISYDKGDEVWGRLVYNNDGTLIKTAEQALSDGSSQNIDWNNLAVSDQDTIFPVWEDERDQISKYADAFGSVWHIYKSSGSPLITYSYGSKVDLVTDATLVSKVIDPDDLDVQKWDEFYSTFSYGPDYCNVEFYVTTSGGSVLADNLGDISNLPVQDIRLKAVFSRSKAAGTPEIDLWGVSYQGSDYDAPWTEIDKNPDSPNGNNNWYTTSVEVELRGFDDGSGVKEIHYIVDDGEEKVKTENPTSFVISQSGSHKIEYWSVDYADNVESHNFDESIVIDNRLPVTTITKPTESEVPAEDIEIEFTVSEQHSGFDKAELYVNDAKVQTWTTEQSTYSYKIQNVGPGEMYNIEAKAFDIAGNMGNAYTTVRTEPQGGTFSYSPMIGYIYTVNGATGDHLLLLMLNLGIVVTDKLILRVKPKEDLGVTKVEFEINGRTIQDGIDTEDSGGFYEYIFDPLTGLYSAEARMYSGEYLVETFDWQSGKILYINAI